MHDGQQLLIDVVPFDRLIEQLLLTLKQPLSLMLQLNELLLG
jgi:hypothetical protein